MEAYHFEDLRRALQQDYILFLSVLGWLLGCLVAWGNATSGEDAPRLPWRLLALFCVTRAVDGIVGIARLSESGEWIVDTRLLLLFIGYTALFDFARRAFNLTYARRVPAAITLIYGFGFVLGAHIPGPIRFSC